MELPVRLQAIFEKFLVVYSTTLMPKYNVWKSWSFTKGSQFETWKNKQENVPTACYDIFQKKFCEESAFHLYSAYKILEKNFLSTENPKKL